MNTSNTPNNPSLEPKPFKTKAEALAYGRGVVDGTAKAPLSREAEEVERRTRYEKALLAQKQWDAENDPHILNFKDPVGGPVIRLFDALIHRGVDKDRAAWVVGSVFRFTINMTKI